MYCERCGVKVDAADPECESCGHRRPRARSTVERGITLVLVAFGVFFVGILILALVEHKPGISGDAAEAEIAATPILHLKRVGPSTLLVAPGTPSIVTVHVTPGMRRAYLSGAFREEGGGSGIRALVLDSDGWINFSNGNSFRDYYDSGDAIVDHLRVGPLARGKYYIVFSIAGAAANTTVVADLRLTWYQ